ncbi:hypothetical protein HZA99_06410 [Candidatus Woesearchaeota archaeon]|nr:hypothetical protein [Candidatus Woesearchaeota archaeon]
MAKFGREFFVFSLLLVLTLALSFVFVSSAFGFEVTTTSEAVIYPNETAEYTFTVINPSSSDERIEPIFGLDSKWSFETDPLSYLSSFTVPAKSSLSFGVRISPISELISSGKYAISIPLRSETGEEETPDLYLYIRNPNALSDYLPSLNFLFDAQENVDPRQTQKVRLDIVNRNPLNITSLDVILESDLYNASQTTHVDPLGTTSVVFEIQYDPHQAPTNDTLELTVVVGEKVFTPIKKQIHILPYADIVEVQYPASSFFFKTTEKAEYTNNGNADTIKQFKYPVSWFSRYFAASDPSGEIVDDQGLYYYQADVLLPLGVPVVYTYSVNYRSILWAILLIGLIAWLYYKFRSPLTVRKEVMTLSVSKEGHMKLKILLHIKNRTLHLVDDVALEDRIPAVAEIDQRFEIGTVKPEKILKHEKAGTILQWHIPHLEAYEERIITYKVGSMYHIVGNFQLPGAVVNFKGRKQRPTKIVSNAVRVGKQMEDR